MENPILYSEVNVVGSINLLSLSVDNKVSKFIFGSSSSVYGSSNKIPFSESDACQLIISPYGASKRAAEIFIESFFKVYGKRGRPDMAPALFTRSFMNSETINQFGNGKTYRDYTYIDDIVDGIIKSIEKDLSFEIINLGNNNPVSINEFIYKLEIILGKKARINKLPMQKGDMQKTWADITKAKNLLGWSPITDFETGLRHYINSIIK